MNKKTVRAWILYDWANTVFALCVMSAFFPILLKQYYLLPENSYTSTEKLGLTNGISGIIIAILSPILAVTIAAKDARKKSLILLSLLGAVSTILIYFVGQGQWVTAVILFALANIGYRLANLSYDALLPAVSSPQNAHNVSSVGFAAGYLGCIVLFSISIFMVSNPAAFGIKNPAEAAKLSILFTGLWWIFFALPLYFAKIPKEPRSDSNFSIKKCFEDLATISVFAVKQPLIRFFLIAYWFYIDGVHTFVMMAADYGLSLGFSQQTLMTALLCVQVTAFPCAIILGNLAKKFGALKIISFCIFVYIIISLGAGWLMKTEGHFIIFACFVGCVQGAIQALSRSLFSLIIPKDRSTELFGLYNTLGRFAVFAGPVFMVISIIIAQKTGFDTETAKRIGVSSLALLFIIGFLFLIPVFRLEKI